MTSPLTYASLAGESIAIHDDVDPLLEPPPLLGALLPPGLSALEYV
jgi:hypothetical protein